MDGASLPADLHALLAEREWLRGLALALASEGSEAEDLEQETWVAALRSPPRKPGPVRGWLATVLRRKALDSRRSAGRRAAREEAAARPAEVPSAAEAVARAETRRRVLDAVLALEEPYRSTVILRWFESLPPREIAARAGVPVETVRTRLRRALETLRERLDEAHGGRREAWAVALLDAAGEPETAPAAEGADPGSRRRRGPGLRVVVPAAALALVAAGAALLLLPPDTRPPTGGLAAGAGGEGGGAPAPPAAAPPAREGGIRAPAKGSPAPVPSPARSEDPPPKAPAGTGLVLRARVEPEVPRFQEKVSLVATFENAGREPVTIFLPDMAGWVVPFPAWRLREIGGDRLHLAEGEWPQSMWEAGPIGEIVRLAPGESRSVETRVHGLLPEGGDPKAAPLPLGPGTYVVECTYANDTRRVPWTEKFGDRGVTREVPGLWTGSVSAEPIEMRVLTGDVPALRLRAPGGIVVGKPCLLEITMHNTASRPLELRGRLVLREVIKGTRGLEASLLPGDPCTEAGPGETAVLRVEPEATLRLTVDLARLSGDWLERRNPMLQVEFEPAGDEPGLSSRAIHLSTLPFPSVAERGIRLLVSPLPGPGLSVLLRNDGEKSLLVPADFAWPSRLHVEVRRPAGAEGEGWITVDEAGGKSRLTARVIGWDVAGKPRPLAAGDFADLVPGGSMAVELPLVSDALPRFPAGEYDVRVSWRNVEGGVRAGLEQGSVLVGTIWSAPVRIEMPAR